MKIGYIGLGKMGKNMVLRLLSQRVEVVAFNRSEEPLKEAVSKGAEKAVNYDDLVAKLPSPRVIWIMVPSQAIDSVISELAPKLNTGDLIIDGGNTFYKDTIRRGEELSKNQIHFMDVAVSGGPEGALNGSCLMIGGEENDFKKMEDLFKVIAAPNAYGYFGSLGAGHFAKMVHNGIEYGMMEAIAEGAMVLRYSKYPFNLSEVFRVYNNRSVIESRLVGWAQESLSQDLSNVSSIIASTGEGEWTVQTAKEKYLKIPVIEDAFEVRKQSQNDPEESPEGFRNKIVSMLRAKFGHHNVEKNNNLPQP